ncbi:MAG: hypothetical protein AAB438_00470 [Patescibacteria group bacterium]
MPNELQIQIEDLISKIEKQNKPYLARQIKQNWNKTALSYSQELNNSWIPIMPMEEELEQAFNLELERLTINEEKRSTILNSLKTKRVVQTGPHLGATENPRMLCINWLGSLGLGSEDFYVVAMFSGIPFSNSFHPGRINQNTGSINLFSSSMQDALVYRSKIEKKLVETIDTLPKELKNLTPKADIGDSYTKWALQTCQNIERSILKKENLIFLDLNEVVTNYLILVLKNTEHPLYKIFFDRNTQKEFINIFPKETLFYTPIMSGKYEIIESFILEDGKLKSKNKEISLENPDLLIEALKEERLCPALVTGFLGLAFINQFKCLGSFRQVEYLPMYQKKLANLACLKKFEIEKIPTENLTTGNFPANIDTYPIDILLGAKFTPNENTLFGELLLPMKNMLLK